MHLGESAEDPSAYGFAHKAEGELGGEGRGGTGDAEDLQQPIQRVPEDRRGRPSLNAGGRGVQGGTIRKRLLADGAVPELD